MIELISPITNYIQSLDWAYMLTFILIAYGFNSTIAKTAFFKCFRLKIATRYRVLIIGILYGFVLFFVRGYSLAMTETLFKSLVFAMVFHKLLVEQFINRIFNLKS